MQKLEGKTVLITGSARRIGRELALGVARAGGDLVIHYLESSAEAEAVQAEIETIGRRASLVSADLNDPDQVSTLIEHAQSHGPLYALVNSAAIFQPLDWKNTSLGAWNRHLNINLTAPFFLSQHFARSLPPNAEGRIVNILDWRALRPGPDHLPYTVSKAALAALTRSLAASFAPGITVNGLALGAVLPPSDGGDTSGLVASIPARRWARLEEVVKALIFLLSGPTYITGEILHVDGGRHLV